jgi:hypothetical protein
MEINLRRDNRNFGGGGVFFGQHNPQNTMKSNILAISSVLAAISALVILPVSAAAAGTAFMAVAVLAALTADYGRNFKPLSLQG